MSNRESTERDALSVAHEARTQQLYEARGALAEAVSTLSAELRQRRQELEVALAEIGALREHVAALEKEREQIADHNRDLQANGEVLRVQLADASAQRRAAEAQLDAVRNLRILRWTALIRRGLYRARRWRR